MKDSNKPQYLIVSGRSKKIQTEVNKYLSKGYVFTSELMKEILPNGMLNFYREMMLPSTTVKNEDNYERKNKIITAYPIKYVKPGEQFYTELSVDPKKDILYTVISINQIGYVTCNGCIQDDITDVEITTTFTDLNQFVYIVAKV
jgi:hypothetical protein